jgi:hypothetical protein
VTAPETMERPPTPFVAMHVAVALLAVGDTAGLDRLAERAGRHDEATQREVVAPLARALRLMTCGRHGEAATALAALGPHVRRLGGSDAQREVVEEARIAALLRCDRWDEAKVLLDERLDRRRSPRDTAWRVTAETATYRAGATVGAPVRRG